MCNKLSIRSARMPYIKIYTCIYTNIRSNVLLINNSTALHAFVLIRFPDIEFLINNDMTRYQ